MTRPTGAGSFCVLAGGGIGKRFYIRKRRQRRCSLNSIRPFVSLVAFCKNLFRFYARRWRRTYRSISAINSFFAHNLCTAVCSWRAGCRGEWLAVIESLAFGGRVHGIRAHGSDAFQPIDRLVARSAQPTNGFASLAGLQARSPSVPGNEFGRICCRSFRN